MTLVVLATDLNMWDKKRAKVWPLRAPVIALIAVETQLEKNVGLFILIRGVPALDFHKTSKISTDTVE